MFCGIPLTELRQGSLTELSLESSNIEHTGVLVLSKLIPTAGSLGTLDLSANGIGPSGLVPLAQLVMDPNLLLHTLNLSKNMLGAAPYQDDAIDEVVEGFQALGSALQENGTLTSLDLSSNHIGLCAAAALVAHGSPSWSLVDLNLAGESALPFINGLCLGAAYSPKWAPSTSLVNLNLAGELPLRFIYISYDHVLHIYGFSCCAHSHVLPFKASSRWLELWSVISF